MKNVDPVALCADYILQDLVGRPGWFPTSLRDLYDLCEHHGGAPLFAWDFPAYYACCYQGEIILSAHSSLSQYREAVLHELVHRLAETERWEPLNYVAAGREVSRGLKRWDFLEMVAERVGRLYAARAGPLWRMTNDRLCHLRRNGTIPPRQGWHDPARSSCNCRML